MVATIDSERTTSKQNNRVLLVLSLVACAGALVALIWLAVVTTSLNEARSNLDITQAATRTLQTQIFDLSKNVQGHESMPAALQTQSGAMKPMPDMPMQGMPMHDMPMQQTPQGTAGSATKPMPGMSAPSVAPSPGAGSMPQQPQAGGMGDM